MPEIKGLRRELGLRDLFFFALAGMISTRWASAAAHAGPGSVTLWLMTAVFFAVPLAIAIAALIVRHPGTGGLYLWTRNDFGPWHGFLAFWVYWVGIALLFPSAALFYMSISSYMFGSASAHLTESRLYMVGGSLVIIWVAIGTNLVGMKVGKWTENIGGAASWILGGLFALIGALVWSKRGSATPINIVPTWNWGTVNFWATIAYAMSGLELAGFMDGEIKDPERNFPRAAWLASGFITAFYIVITISMLVVLPPEQISELNGMPQVGVASAALLKWPWIPGAVGALIMVNALGVFGGLATAVSRLPMAAGADNLLPSAFAKIHPKWGTPHISLLTFGAVASVLLVLIQLGDSMRAAYDTLVSLMVLVGFLPYIYIFGSAWKAGKQIAALSGWAITALAIVCSLVPPADMKNVWAFEGKIAIGTIAIIASAWFVYHQRKQ